MTKNKSKKMKKSTIAIIVMAFVMVAMIAFGGTYAYFTATATAQSGSFTTGYVKLASTGTFVQAATNVMPGDKILTGGASVTVDTTDVAGNYVAIQFVIVATDSEGATIANLADVGLAVTPGTGWVETATTGIFIWGSNATTATAAMSGTLTIFSGDLTFVATDDFRQGQTTSDNKLMGASVTITLKARSIQASNITAGDAVALLIALF